MKTKIELITPEIATDILENHYHANRRLSEQTVQSYATDMRNGRWILNHQGIAFDTNGGLIDGQHRMWAVIFSGKEVEMMVTRDVPVTENKNGIELCPMDTIDRMRVRQNGQQMQLCHGIINGNQVAACCRAIVILVYPARGNNKLSTANCLLVHELYAKDIGAVLECLAPRKRVGHITAPLVMFHHGEPDAAREFCRQISTLENLSPSARAFCKYLETTNKGMLDKTARILCQCLKNFHEGNAVTKIQDCPGGREFIVGMFPSFAKRIREAIKPCETRPLKLSALKQKARP